MLLPEYNARDLLAANVAALMERSEDKRTAKKLAAKCRWPDTAGPKRRGQPLSERYIRYVLNPTPDAAHSPSIDVVTAIAEAFDVQAWQLLVDDKHLRSWVVGKLMAAGGAVISDAEVEKHLPFPPARGETVQRRPKGKGR